MALEEIKDNRLTLSTTINSSRFLADLDALSKIGATEKGGVNRPAFSKDHIAARKWFLQRAKEAGLTVKVDAAGNHSAILHQSDATKILVLGSHLDSVPNGGRFDGALGVVAALEVLRRVKEKGSKLSVNLEAIDFTDEESHFVEYLGSKAFTGKLGIENLLSPRQEQFQRAIEKIGLSEPLMILCGRAPQDIAGFIELHIEQGPHLENDCIDIGIVQSIVGIRNNRYVFKGRSDHSGTTPRNDRLDAGLGAASFILAAHNLIKTDFQDCVTNVGNMVFSPGVTNVVPEKVEIYFEYRFPDDKQGTELETSLYGQAKKAANIYGLDFEVISDGYSGAVHMDPELQKVATAAVEALGLKSMKMNSGAGHDAQVLSSFTQTALIFVPSVSGISHNPAEFTNNKDCENGANVLLKMVLNNYLL